MAYIVANGIEIPYPARGLKKARQQLVDSKRNALGQVVAQKINRRLTKIDSLEWSFLTASQWRIIQQLVDEFEVTVRFWDNPSGAFVTRKMYWGDESAEVFKIDPDTGEELSYVNCTVNLIDCGY